MTGAEAIIKLKKDFVQENPQLTVDDVEIIFSKAFDYYASVAFPFEHNVETLPDNRIADTRYIKMFMRNIIDRPDNTAFKSYSENGLSYSLDGTVFDQSIAKLIIPKGKVIFK